MLRRFPGDPLTRVPVVAAGVALTWVWFRLAADAVRPPVCHRLVALSWAAGGALAVAAALRSPLGPGWAVPVAIGSTLGATLPMLPAAERGERALGDGAAELAVTRPGVWLVAGVVAGALFVGVFGPGVSL